MKYKSLDEVPLEFTMSLQEEELIEMVEDPDSGSDVEMDGDGSQKRKVFKCMCCASSRLVPN